MKRFLLVFAYLLVTHLLFAQGQWQYASIGPNGFVEVNGYPSYSAVLSFVA